MKQTSLNKILLLIILISLISCSSSDNSENNPDDQNPDNISGTVDNNFGNNGQILTGFGQGYEVLANDAILQNDGKIIVVGNCRTLSNGNTGFAVARYNNDGSLDNSFSSDGKLTTDIITTLTTSLAYANTVGVMPNGQIIVAGSDRYSQFAIVKYNNDGSIDNSFGSNGRIIEPIGYGNTATNIRSAAQSIYVLNDGKFIICGLSYSFYQNNLSLSLALVKYNSNGTHDNSFGNNGISLTTIKDNLSINPGDIAYAKMLYNQTSNKLIVATNINSNVIVDEYKKLFSFNMNGFLDNTFGNSGAIDLPQQLSAEWKSPFIITDNQKYLIGGTKYTEEPGGNWKIFHAVCYNILGNIENDYAANGFFNFAFGSTTSDIIYDFGNQSSGKIIVAGQSYDNTRSTNDIALCRLNLDGTIDESFGIDGKISTTINSNAVAKLLINSDDQIIVVFTKFPSASFGIIKYNK